METTFSGMAQGFYEMFWRECGTHGLTTQQKINVLCRLRDLSLKIPYWTLKENDKHERKTLTELFPELIPSNLCRKHAHLAKLSGLLLYTMHMQIFGEIQQLAQEGKLAQKQLKQIGAF